VAGTVSDARLVQFTTRGWTDVDLSVLTADPPADRPATVARQRRHARRSRRSPRRGAGGHRLHLLVAAGLGGTLVVNGEPVTGAHGAAGEHGHAPSGPAHGVPVRAHGCWDLSRRRPGIGAPPRRTAARRSGGVRAEVLSRPADERTTRAFESVAAALGAGIGGLVNLHDPDVVTLGDWPFRFGAAAPQAFEDGYRDGLMSFRKASAPPVCDGAHGDDGPLYGATAWRSTMSPPKPRWLSGRSGSPEPVRP
jgi:predicted NBD/HSP70 family sugar kinase